MALFDDLDKEFGIATAPVPQPDFSGLDKEFGFDEKSLDKEFGLSEPPPDLSFLPPGEVAPGAPQETTLPETTPMVSSSTDVSPDYTENRFPDESVGGITTPLKAVATGITRVGYGLFDALKDELKQTKKILTEKKGTTPAPATFLDSYAALKSSRPTEAFEKTEALKTDIPISPEDKQKNIEMLDKAILVTGETADRIDNLIPQKIKDEVAKVSSGELNPLKNPSEALLTWSTIMGDQVGLWLSNLGGPGLGATVAITSMRDEFKKNAEQHGFSEDEYQSVIDKAALQAGMLEYAGEVATLGLSKKIPGLNKLTKPLSNFLGKTVLGKIAATTGSSVAEGLTEYSQQALYNHYLGQIAKEKGWNEQQIKEKFKNDPILKSRDFWVGVGIGGLMGGGRAVVEEIAKPAETFQPETAVIEKEVAPAPEDVSLKPLEKPQEAPVPEAVPEVVSPQEPVAATVQEAPKITTPEPVTEAPAPETPAQPEAPQPEVVSRETAAPKKEEMDELTSLPGRNKGRQYVKKALDDKKTIFHFDIDDFKSINEEYSHATGDEVLAKIGEAINKNFPENERARLGGEEFAVVLEGADDAKIKSFIDDVSKNVFIEDKDTGTKEPITVSGGVAAGKKGDALYADILGGKAKKAGKNQIIVDKGDGKEYTIIGEPKERGYAKRYRERDFLVKGQEILGDETLSPEVRKSIAGALQRVKEERSGRVPAVSTQPKGEGQPFGGVESQVGGRGDIPQAERGMDKGPGAAQEVAPTPKAGSQASIEPKKLFSEYTSENIKTYDAKTKMAHVTFAPGFENLSPKEKFKALTKERKAVSEKIEKGIASGESVTRLERLHKALKQEQGKYSTSSEDTAKRESAQIKRWVDAGEVKTEIQKQGQEETVRFLDKPEIAENPLKINDYLTRKFTKTEIKGAIAAIRRGKPGGPAARQIRKDVGEYFATGTHSTQIIDAVKKDKEKVQREPGEDREELDKEEPRRKPDEEEDEIPFQKKVVQRDLFGGPELTPEELAEKERKRAEKEAVEEKASKKRGGQADIGGLPMFENQDFNGSQQTLFQRGEKDGTTEQRRDIYLPPGPEHAALKKGLEISLGHPVDGDQIVFLKPDREGALSQRFFEKLHGLGFRIVRLSPALEQEASFNGVYIRKTVYVNESNQHPVFLTASHEALHYIERTHPDLYAPVKEFASENMTEAARETVAQLEKLGDKSGASEVLNDFAAEQMADIGFWNELYNRAPESAKALLRRLTTIYKQMTEYFRGKKITNTEMFRNTVQIRDMLTDMYAKVLEREASGDTSEAPLFQIKAFHGSPFKFSKFEMRPRTGEGAMAFGRGLYFTSEKQIAEHYKKSTSEHRNRLINGQFSDAVREIEDSGGKVTKQSVIDKIKEIYKDFKENNISYSGNGFMAQSFKREYERALELAEEMKPEEYGGSVYSVTLHKGKKPSEYDYLQWDRPVVDKQVNKIEKAIRVYSKTVPGDRYSENRARNMSEDIFGDRYKVVGGIQKSWNMTKKDAEDYSRKWGGKVEPETTTGQMVYRGLAMKLGSDKDASEFLLRAGIDGIEYPAGSLSGVKSDARNYVVFDPEAVTIEEATSFQRKAQPEDKNLVAIHNISASKIIHADKLGGIAMPSVAITKKDIPFTIFGDISLIVRKNTIDPKSRLAKSFDADIYSPRYPTMKRLLNRKAVNDKYNPLAEKYAKEITDDSSYGEQIRDRLKSKYTVGDYVNDQISGGDERYLRRDSILGMAFLDSKDINYEKTRKGIDDKIYKENLQSEFDDFVDTFLDKVTEKKRFFKGYTYSGSRRYKDYTLDNIVSEMKKELRGGENFNYGAGSVRAQVAKKFSSIQAMKKEAGRLEVGENVEDLKSRFNDTLSNIASGIAETRTGGNPFSGIDNVVEGIIEGIKRHNIKGELESYGFDVSDQDMKEIGNFLEDLRSAPTEYFEAKVSGAMELSSFAGAIIPKGTTQKVKDILDRNELQYVEYDPNSEGDRVKKVQEFTEEKDLAFQRKVQPAETAGAVEGKEERARKLWAEKGTESPYFKKWFAGSKVVDESGKPLVVYHGTDKSFNEFDAGESVNGAFFFTPEKGLSGAYGKNNVAVYLDIKNPFESPLDLPGAREGYTTKGDFIEAMKREGVDVEDIHGNIDPDELLSEYDIWELYNGSVIKKLKEAGYDGLLLSEEHKPTYAAFSPNQIKSATGNIGTFSEESDDIRFQRRTPEAESKVITWPKDFPRVKMTAIIGKLKTDPDYTAAKAGDSEAAFNLVNRLVSDAKAKQIVEETKPDIIVSVNALEQSGENKIPIAYANKISITTGIPVDGEIYQSNQVSHTGESKIGRLLKKPEFTGEVQPGKKYLVVDDVVTSGGSLNELRKHIIRNGGEVVGFSAISSARPQVTTGAPSEIALSEKTIDELTKVLTADELSDILRGYGYENGIYELTNSQARHLASLKTIDAIRDEISKGEYPRISDEVREDLPEVAQFKDAKDTVSGLRVTENIPNQSSIESTLTDYTVLPGIKEVPFSAFEVQKYPATERTRALSEKIKQSGEIDPLIVVIDKDGPYVLEGGHRYDALGLLGKKYFPAMVVVDNESIPQFQRKLPGSEDRESGIDGTPEETVWDKIQQKVQDKYLRLKKLQDAIDPNIKEEMDAYLAEELYHGRVESKLDEFEKDYFKPFREALGKSDITQEQLEEFLYAKHAPERNAHIQEINPEFRENDIPGSGMSDEEAGAIIQAAKDSGKYDELERLSQFIYDINSRSRRQLLDAGLISEDMKSAWEKYKYYVPLRGIKEEDTRPRTGKGFDVRGKESKRALGRKSKATNIIANTVVGMNQAIIRAEKNKVGEAFLKFVEENPNKDLWEIDAVEYKSVFDENKGEVVQRIDPKYRLADNVMSVKRDGKEYYITIKDPALARGMVNLGAEKANKAIQILGAASRYLSMVNTSLVPEFVISNLSRDLQTAMINMGGEYDAKLAGTIVKSIPKAMKGVWQGEKGKSSEWAKWYREFKQQGGKIGFFGLESVDDIQKSIVKELKLMQPGKKAAVIKSFRAVKNLVFSVNEAVENSTRLATYVEMRKRGMSKAKAASVAKNVTVNFNRKGELGSAMNALYVFSNAGVQGTARLFRALKNPRVQKIAAGIALGSIALAQMNRMIGGDDDDDKNFYDKIPNWVKENNLIIMKPGTKGEYFKIPIPYGYNIFWALGQAIDKSAHNRTKDDILSAAGNLAGAVANSFNPLGSSSTLLQTITPTAGRWLVDLGLNKNFFGAPIVKEDKFGVPKAKAHTSFESTSAQSKAIAQTLNDLTGGTKYQPGLIDISPDLMDYAGEFVTGGAGRTLNQTISLAANLGTGKPVSTRSIPFVRRALGKVEPYQNVQDYYTNVDQLEKTRADYENLKETDKRKSNAFYLKNKQALDYTKKQKTSEIRPGMTGTSPLTIEKKLEKGDRETTPINVFESELKTLREQRDAAEQKGQPTEKYEEKIMAKVKRFNMIYSQKTK